jgi:hypothetical protein
MEKSSQPKSKGDATATFFACVSMIVILLALLNA